MTPSDLSGFYDHNPGQIDIFRRFDILVGNNCRRPSDFCNLLRAAAEYIEQSIGDGQYDVHAAVVDPDSGYIGLYLRQRTQEPQA